MYSIKELITILFVSISQFLANEKLCIVNYIDDVVNQIVRGKEELMSLSRFLLAVRNVTGNEQNNVRLGCESARCSPTTNQLGLASEHTMHVYMHALTW